MVFIEFAKIDFPCFLFGRKGKSNQKQLPSALLLLLFPRWFIKNFVTEWKCQKVWNDISEESEEWENDSDMESLIEVEDFPGRYLKHFKQWHVDTCFFKHSL